MPRTTALLSSPFARELLTLLLLGLAVTAVYAPPAPSDGGPRALRGIDYEQLHVRRIGFAQENLFGPGRALPAWYPREMLGMPFWSYTVSFPFIPTRLALVFTLGADRVYTAAIVLAAVLSAWFAYLYCRAVGLGMWGGAAAGWTFACAGYFAARVLAGHLAILEAYPALPLLAWLCELIVQRVKRRASYLWPALGLAFSTTFVALAGHPQVPMYALGAAALYVLARRSARATLAAAGSMALGFGMGAFALWPMALLVARSTRTMGLAAASNDIPMPYWRLVAFLFPWRHGAPAGAIPGAAGYPFTVAGDAYFWDTVCYVGWLPWLALGALLAFPAGRARLRERPVIFWVVLGFVALALALPFGQDVVGRVLGKFLRAPVRQLYLTTFALALLFGLGVDVLARAAREARARAAVLGGLGVLVLVHAVDLGRHARAFVQPGLPIPTSSPALVSRTRAFVGDGRIGMDSTILNTLNRQIDDVGLYESLALARPYRMFLSLHAQPHDAAYEERVDGGGMSRRALEAAAVRMLITGTPRDDLALLQDAGRVRLYAVGERVASRVTFFPLARVTYLDAPQIHRNLADQSYDLSANLMLPPDARRLTQNAGAATSEPSAMAYRRVSSDEIEVDLTAGTPGFLRVNEAFDPGWRATADGAPLPTTPANDALLAVYLPAGKHAVRFTYHTVGLRAGVGIALVSVCGLIPLATWATSRGQRRPADPPGPQANAPLPSAA